MFLLKRYEVFVRGFIISVIALLCMLTATAIAPSIVGEFRSREWSTATSKMIMYCVLILTFLLIVRISLEQRPAA